METSRRVEIVSRSPEDTQGIGRALGSHARPGDVYLLAGELGSGKTCLTQGVLWGLGAEGYARSPSYVLVSQYRGRLVLYHIDLFRLETAAEVADLGLEEYLFGDGICVIEWADKVAYPYPEAHLMVRFEYVDVTTRRLTLTSCSQDYDGAMSAVSSAVAGR